MAFRRLKRRLLPRDCASLVLCDRDDIVGMYKLRITAIRAGGGLFRIWPFVIALGNHLDADPAFAAPSGDSSYRRHGLPQPKILAAFDVAQSAVW